MLFWGVAIPAVVAVGILLIASAVPQPRARELLYGALQTLTAIQGGVLVLVGAGVIGSAMARDVASGMIASHRLMPISGIEAVAGYMAGCLAVVLAAGGSFFLLGMVIAAAAQVPAGNWLMANLILLVFAVLVWCMVACLALQYSGDTRGHGASGLWVFLFFGVHFLMIGPAILPGLALFVGPVVGRTVFGVVERGAALDSTYGISFFAQLLAAVLFFAGAARKYRRQDVLGCTPWMGIAAVALFAAATMIGTLGWGGFKSGWFEDEFDSPVLRTVAGGVAGALLALLPVTGCAWIAARYRRRPDMRTVTGMPMPPAAACLLCTLILTAIPAIILADRATPDRLARTAVIFAATLFSCSYLARIVYRRLDKAQWPLIVWLGLTWLVPPAVDFARAIYSMQQTSPAASELDDPGQVFAAATRFSPPGALARIWSGHETDTTWGIGFQVVLAVAMAGLFEYGRRAQAARRTAAGSSAAETSGDSAGGFTAGP